MKSKYIFSVLVFLMCYSMVSVAGLAQSASIWFNSPTNGATYYTNAGESSLSLRITWNWVLAYPDYFGELVKVWLDSEQLPDNTYPDVTRYVSIGGHTYRAELWQSNTLGQWVKTAETQISFTVLGTYNVTVQNSFGGGNVKVDGASYASGTTFAWRSGENHTLEAIDGQSYGGYVRRFYNWSGGVSGSNISVPITATQNSTCTANFKREFNVIFQNSFVSVENGGVIKVNGTQYNSPTSSFPVVEDYTISGEAVYQVINNIQYTFSQWSDGNTSSSRTFTPTDHATFTANFTGKPTQTPNVSAGGSVGSNVQVTWAEHPNQYVSEYRIWRKVKDGPGPSQIGTVSRGTTSFTDYSYVVTAGYTDNLLYYDARAYYSLESSSADPNWSAVFGKPDIGPRITQDATKSMTLRETPLIFSISNYPNPFNPSTTIKLALPKETLLTLDIYNILGEKVRTLINGETYQAGYVSVVWDGRDNLGRASPSGIYFYRIATGELVKTVKMILMK